MSREFPLLRRRVLFTSTVLLSLCVLLSACGGGGTTQVASIPPPPPTPTPTPTPTPAPLFPAADAYPITRAATYDLIGTQRNSGVTAPGAFTLGVSKASDGYAYRISGPAGFLPVDQTSLDYGPGGGSWSIGGNGYLRGGYGQKLPYDADKSLSTGLGFEASDSYVSMGEWSWYFVHPDGGSAEGGYGQLLFVAGDRTPWTGIPTSGTATYDAHTFALLSSNLTIGIPFTLTADFGQRTISTHIDQDYRYIAQNADLLDDPAPGIHVSGSASFSNSGSFDIPLAGSATPPSYNVPTAPPLQPVTGSMNGAFFGPHAEQVGGVFSLQNSTGVQLLQDAFVGQQHQP